MMITLTQDEARELSRRWLETPLDQNIQVELLPNEAFSPRLGAEYRIALIKFARTLTADISACKIKPSEFDLSSANKYVVNYLGL